MKLHLPFGLLASVLACYGVASTIAYGEEESTYSPTRISVNFGAAVSDDVTASTGLAPAAEWNDVGTGGTVSVTDSEGREYTLVTSGGAGTWNNGNNVTDVASALLYGYLDLKNYSGASESEKNWSVEMETDMLYSRVSLYMSNDAKDCKYLPVVVNGTLYKGGTDVQHNSASDLLNGGNWQESDLWGDTDERTTLSDSNTVSVTMVGGSLTASNISNFQTASPSANNHNQGRTTLAGFSVTDMTWSAEGTAINASKATFRQYSATETKGYTSSILDNIAAGNRYLGFTDGQTVTFAGGTSLDGIQGSGLVTIQKGDGTEGVTVPILYARKDATLKVANDMLAGAALSIQGLGVVEIAAQQTALAGADAGGLITIDGGTLKVTAEGGASGFTSSSVTVGAGGKLILTKVDNLGYDTTCTPSVTLQGAEGNLATLQLDERQTTSTTIYMKGYAEISGSETNSQLQTFANNSGSDTLIIATGTNNTISTKLSIDRNLTLQVGELTGTTADTSELTLSGTVVRYADASGNKTITKTGRGTLVVSRAAGDSYVSYVVNDGTLKVTAKGALGSSDIEVQGGTLEIGYRAVWSSNIADSGKAFTQADINVGAGATLLLNAHDSLGYNEGNSVGTVTLTGTDAQHMAKMQLGSGANTNETSSANIVLNGYAELSLAEGVSGKHLMTFGGTDYGVISAFNTNNTISAPLKINQNLTVQVGALTGTSDSSTLDITGSITGDAANKTITKTGLGTLVVSSAAGDSNVSYVVNDGTLKVTAAANGGSAFNRKAVTVNAGATLHLVNEDNMGYSNNRLQTINLAGTSDAARATLVLDARQTMQTNINMQGYATIMKGTDAQGNSTAGSLNPYSEGRITASGSGNVISADILLRDELVLDVSGSLSLEGSLERHMNGTETVGSGGITKIGAGTLTIEAIDATTSVIDAAGFTISAGKVVNNRTLEVTSLTLAEGASFTNNAALTLTGTVVLGAVIENTGTIDFASGAQLDMTDMASTLVDGNKYTYSVASGAGSVSGLDVSMLTGITMDGKEWHFETASTGTFYYTLTAKSLVSSSDLASWMVGSDIGGASFASGDMVTFEGASTATLGADVTSSGIIIAEGAKVTLAEGTSEGDRVLTADSVQVKAGGTLTLSGTGMLNTQTLSVEGARTDEETGVDIAAGHLILSGAELASGVRVEGEGKLEIAGTGYGVTSATDKVAVRDSLIQGFAGELIISDGVLRHTDKGTWDALKSVTITGTGTALFFGTGDGSDYNGSINVSGLAAGHARALWLDGGKLEGNIHFSCSAEIFNQWDGELYSALVSETKTDVSLTGRNTLHVASDMSGLTGDVIVDTSGTVSFFSKENSNTTSTIENTGDFIVRSGMAQVRSAISNTGKVSVEDGATLNVIGVNQSKDVTLKGGTLSLQGCMYESGTTIQLEAGSSVVSGNNAALHAAITGSGDLTLKGVSDRLYVYSDASFKGKLEMTEGNVDLGHAGIAGATIRNTGDVNIKGATVGMYAGSTIKNDGDVVVSSGALTVNSGTSVVNQSGKSGVVKVSGGSLVVEEGATLGREVNLGTLNGEAFTKKASISGIDGNATYKGVTVTATTISGGTLENAGVRVIDSGIAISGMTLKNSTLTVEEALQMNNVVLEGSSVVVTETGSFATGSVVSLTGEENSLTAALVAPTEVVSFNSASLGTENDYHSFTSNQLSGVTLAAGGMLTVDVAGAAFRELIVDASQQVEAVNGKQYYYVALTLQGFAVEQQVGYSQESPLADTANGLALGSLLGKGLVTGYDLGIDSTTIYMRFDAQSIPEPTTATLSLLALAALAARRRRR